MSEENDAVYNLESVTMIHEFVEGSNVLVCSSLQFILNSKKTKHRIMA
jgi:hypothetical protein